MSYRLKKKTYITLYKEKNASIVSLKINIRLYEYLINYINWYNIVFLRKNDIVIFFFYDGLNNSILYTRITCEGIWFITIKIINIAPNDLFKYNYIILLLNVFLRVYYFSLDYILSLTYFSKYIINFHINLHGILYLLYIVHVN